MKNTILFLCFLFCSMTSFGQRVNVRYLDSTVVFEDKKIHLPLTSIDLKILLGTKDLRKRQQAVLFGNTTLVGNTEEVNTYKQNAICKAQDRLRMSMYKYLSHYFQVDTSNVVVDRMGLSQILFSPDENLESRELISKLEDLIKQGNYEGQTDYFMLTFLKGELRTKNRKFNDAVASFGRGALSSKLPGGGAVSGGTNTERNTLYMVVIEPENGKVLLLTTIKYLAKPYSTLAFGRKIKRSFKKVFGRR